MEEIKLPHLFIDTCIIFGDYQLNSNIFKKILAYKRCTNCRVFIPEICVLELIEHYRRNILGDEGVEKIVNNLDKKVQEANKYIYKWAMIYEYIN